MIVFSLVALGGWIGGCRAAKRSADGSIAHCALVKSGSPEGAPACRWLAIASGIVTYSAMLRFLGRRTVIPSGARRSGNCQIHTGHPRQSKRNSLDRPRYGRRSSMALQNAAEQDCHSVTQERPGSVLLCSTEQRRKRLETRAYQAQALLQLRSGPVSWTSTY